MLNAVQVTWDDGDYRQEQTEGCGCTETLPRTNTSKSMVTSVPNKAQRDGVSTLGVGALRHVSTLTLEQFPIAQLTRENKAPGGWESSTRSQGQLLFRTDQPQTLVLGRNISGKQNMI